MNLPMKPVFQPDSQPPVDHSTACPWSPSTWYVAADFWLDGQGKNNSAGISKKPGPKNGFEELRLLVAEYMLKSRREILHFRNALVNRTFKAASITELIQNLDCEENRYQKLLAMLPAHGLLIQSSDFSMILFRSLTGSARDYVMLLSKTDEYVDLKAAALRYGSRSRIWTEISGNTNSTTCTMLWMVGRKENEKARTGKR